MNLQEGGKLFWSVTSERQILISTPDDKTTFAQELSILGNNTSFMNFDGDNMVRVSESFASTWVDCN